MMRLVVTQCPSKRPPRDAHRPAPKFDDEEDIECDKPGRHPHFNGEEIPLEHNSEWTQKWVQGQYERHYHAERTHQSIGNRLIVRDGGRLSHGPVRCRPRLGGLLRFCRRASAGIRTESTSADRLHATSESDDRQRAEGVLSAKPSRYAWPVPLVVSSSRSRSWKPRPTPSCSSASWKLALSTPSSASTT